MACFYSLLACSAIFVYVVSRVMRSFASPLCEKLNFCTHLKFFLALLKLFFACLRRVALCVVFFLSLGPQITLYMTQLVSFVENFLQLHDYSQCSIQRPTFSLHISSLYSKVKRIVFIGPKMKNQSHRSQNQQANA